MQIFNPGDSVAVLDDTIKGKVVVSSGSVVVIEDEDGFERHYHPSKIVIQKSETDYRIGNKLKDKEANELLAQRVRQKQAFTRSKSQSAKHVIDLHIEELIDDHSDLENHEIIQIQMTACRSFIRQSIDNGLKKVVIIHGKGQGVLKSEIYHYLPRLSNDLGLSLTFHDANFRSFGMGGATEVILK